MSDPQPLRLVIDPIPGDREVAAITAAVMAVTSARPEPEATPTPNPWREANKRESMRRPLEEITP